MDKECSISNTVNALITVTECNTDNSADNSADIYPGHSETTNSEYFTFRW